MGVTLVITNSVLCMTLALLFYTPPGVNGFQICGSSSVFGPTKFCDDNEHCCGFQNADCCPDFIIPTDRSQQEAMEAAAAFIVLMVFTCFCICCYRCCCRRTTSRGFVYSTPGPTTSVSVTLPPQSQQVPYPTVVPYPQQTPFPPQYNPPTNPYYGMPPPAYGVAVQSDMQQASAPSAPYIQS